MSEATRQQALIKLAAINNKIGYPDKWRDYSALDGQAAVEHDIEWLLAEEGFGKRHGKFFGHAIRADEQGTNPVLLVGVALKVVGEAVEAVEGEGVAGIDAEFHRGFTVGPAIADIAPYHLKVGAIDDRGVIRSLDEEATIDAPSQIRGANRIDADSFDLDQCCVNTAPLHSCVDESGDRETDADDADGGQPAA